MCPRVQQAHPYLLDVPTLLNHNPDFSSPFESSTPCVGTRRVSLCCFWPIWHWLASSEPHSCRPESKMIWLRSQPAAGQTATRQSPHRQLHSSQCVGFVAAHGHLSTSRGLIAAARAGGGSSRARSRVATAAAAYSKDATGLSSLRFAKPEGGEMAQLMSEWER